MQYKYGLMSKMEQFTACLEPASELLVSPRNVLQSPAATEVFKGKLAAHHTFWSDRIIAATRAESERRHNEQEDIADAKRMTAIAFHDELDAVVKDMDLPHARNPRQPIPIIRRAASILSLSTLYQRIILTPSSGETAMAPVPEVDGTVVGDANVLPDILEDDSGHVYGYALHVSSDAVADHFKEDALPFMFAEKWCAVDGLYVHCLNPAKPELALYTSPQVRSANVEFDNMVTMYPHLGVTPDLLYR